MSRHLVMGLVIAAALASASLAAASVPSPGNSTVDWAPGGAFIAPCPFPTICPRAAVSPGVADLNATINLTVKDQFGAPMGAIGAADIIATGVCLLGSGSPCGQVLSVAAQGATNGSGVTTIVIGPGHVGGKVGAGGCCNNLDVSVRGVVLKTLTFRSFDYTADLAVNLSDLGFLADTFNKILGNAGYNACFDFNCDNAVNLSDLGFFADHFNHVCA